MFSVCQVHVHLPSGSSSHTFVQLHEDTWQPLNEFETKFRSTQCNLTLVHPLSSSTQQHILFHLYVVVHPVPHIVQVVPPSVLHASIFASSITFLLSCFIKKKFRQAMHFWQYNVYVPHNLQFHAILKLCCANQKLQTNFEISN